MSNGTVATGSIPTDLTLGTGDSGIGNERVRITSDGKVGIGTSAPAGVLHVGGAGGASFFDTISSTGATASGELRQRRARGAAGTESQVLSGDRLALLSGSGWMDVGGYSGGRAAIAFFAAENFSSTANGAYVTIETTPTGSTSRVERVRIDAAGNVGIGTAPNSGTRLHVSGNAQFDGTVTGTYIKAHYQDVAEWVPSTSDLAPGTVVVLDGGNIVTASHRSYDTTVAGVVSEQPGIILGEEGASKEQVATTGRVRVKVDASRGPIAVGDLLVTSDKSGYAMRSTPIDIGGAQIHRPGTIVGKALEPLAGGQGEILVLLSLQ